MEAGGFEAFRGLIWRQLQAPLKAHKICGWTPCCKFSEWRGQNSARGLLFLAFKASSHQIVWFGGKKMSYPKSAIVDLSNDVWHAYIRWRMWPGEQPEILVNNGHLMGTRLFSSIFGGWRLFQPFFWGKLVMGLSNEGIPSEIFNFGDPPFRRLFIEFETSRISPIRWISPSFWISPILWISPNSWISPIWWISPSWYHPRRIE